MVDNNSFIWSTLKASKLSSLVSSHLQKSVNFCKWLVVDFSFAKKYTMHMKLANALTLSRALFAPIFFLIYFVPIWTDTFVFASGVIMISLLACMEITDFFDRFFARKSKMVTDLGKMFDPFADVIVHLTTFTCFLYSYNEQFAPYTPVLIFIFILYREFTQTFFRMLAAKQGVAIGARKGGKLKTVFYVVTSFFLPCSRMCS